ncbi:hypothetical protein C8R46DRAFT_1186868 [Mycena filopes]|nr:hypothetical protein C8R46DRAFT_1186868 [Mycena filopes]
MTAGHSSKPIRSRHYSVTIEQLCSAIAGVRVWEICSQRRRRSTYGALEWTDEWKHVYDACDGNEKIQKQWETQREGKESRVTLNVRGNPVIPEADGIQVGLKNKLCSSSGRSKSMQTERGSAHTTSLQVWEVELLIWNTVGKGTRPIPYDSKQPSNTLSTSYLGFKAIRALPRPTATQTTASFGLVQQRGGGNIDISVNFQRWRQSTCLDVEDLARMVTIVTPTGFSMHCHEINMPVVHITLTRLVQQRPRTGDCRARLRAMHDHLKGPDHRQYHSDGTAYYPTEWECNKFTAMVEQVEHRPAALKVMALTMSPHIPADSRHNRARPGDWQHPAELDYIGPDHPSAQMWNDYSIITYMVSNTVTVPKRTDNRSDPWVTVTTPNEGTATLPRGYRIPLLWLTKVQWETTKVLLTHARPLWDHIKWDVLHLARLTAQFLGKARSEARMKRQWRDATFDRVLHRFFNGWMGCRETFVSHFYDEFKDDEYKDDALARRWAQKVPKGIQGFSCTEEEIVDGIGPETLHAGPKIDRLDATFEWIPDPDEDEIVVDPVVEPAPAPAAPLAAPAAAQPVVQPRTEPAPANASQQETAATGSSQSRGSSPLTSDLGSDIDMIAQSLNPTESTASTSTHRPLTQIVIPSAPTTTTTSAPPRKKSHKPKPRLPATERDSFSGAAPRPLRTRTMSGSLSGMSPATPQVARHLTRNDSSTGSSPNRTPQLAGFDFTAPVESRGRKRKIESIYSDVSPSPLTSDSDGEEDGSGRGSRAPNNNARTLFCWPGCSQLFTSFFQCCQSSVQFGSEPFFPNPEPELRFRFGSSSNGFEPF